MKNPKGLSSYTLCADDFALSTPISETIAQLAVKGCINAISCMATMPSWPGDARLLCGIGGDGGAQKPRAVEVGLHLVLAGEQPLTRLSWQRPDGRLPGADETMMLAYGGQLDLDQLSREIEAQFVAFITARGHAPDFVDAHQHVHVFPGIREIVIAAARRHAPGAWMRNPADGVGAMLKRPFRGKAFGSTLHARGLGKALKRAGIAANDSFAGHYDYRGDESDFAALLPRFFHAAGRRHLIMCHPGAGHLEEDGIARARIVEAAVIGQMPLTERLAELRATS
ncbi:MAG TPA: ChbG/HpnK family deacetylase [Sphingobium sp.]|uniref:ChbG/HpnK family deacetylase n=1 Tax=Sphingobium sp. TaxID=1912891 RepID=UPI002ED3014D